MADRTLAQRRAADAYEKIELVSKRDAEFQKRYRSYVAGLPAMIVMSGLGQALASLLSRAGTGGPDKSAHRLLYDHVAKWLGGIQEEAPYRQVISGETKLLIDEINKRDQATYLHAQAEAMAYLEWLKKFAQAFLAGE